MNNSDARSRAFFFLGNGFDFFFFLFLSAFISLLIKRRHCGFRRCGNVVVLVAWCLPLALNSIGAMGRISGATASRFQRSHKRRRRDLPKGRRDTGLGPASPVTAPNSSAPTGRRLFLTPFVPLCPSKKRFVQSVAEVVKEEAAESTCPPPTAPPPPHTHTLILCPNPHVTPHLVMKTSSIIPLDRPQGPMADSSVWGSSLCEPR